MPSQPDRTFTLSSQCFAMLFAASVELLEAPDIIEAEEGASSQTASRLIEILGPIRDAILEPTEILVASGNEATAAPRGSSAGGDLSAAKVQEHPIILKMPEDLASIWPRLLTAVVGRFGDQEVGKRELFLRTGYHRDELEGAIATLSGFLNA